MNNIENNTHFSKFIIIGSVIKIINKIDFFEIDILDSFNNIEYTFLFEIKNYDINFYEIKLNMDLILEGSILQAKVKKDLFLKVEQITF